MDTSILILSLVYVTVPTVNNALFETLYSALYQVKFSLKQPCYATSGAISYLIQIFLFMFILIDEL